MAHKVFPAQRVRGRNYSQMNLFATEIDIKGTLFKPLALRIG